MLLHLVVFIAGLLTILGPCILPIVPMVFARSDPSAARERVPMLVGLAVTFAVVASAATASATWVARANELGRWGALLLLGTVGLALVVPRAAVAVSRPFVRLGERLDRQAAGRLTRGRAVVVGAAIGLLWAPCAGPVLGLVVAAAVAQGGGLRTASLFFAYALGAATSLFMVLLGGGRLLARLKQSQTADRFVRPVLGVLTLAGVLVIASGLDRTLYARAGLTSTDGAEAALVQRLSSAAATNERRGSIGESLDDFARRRAGLALADEGVMPALDGATTWINSPPLNANALRGKVVMIDFWTFGCYNCLNALPHVKALEAKYRDRGFVVIGVHTPEFAREKIVDNVRREITRLGVVYPVVVDNDYQIWRAFHNEYWPAAYFVDKAGRIRYHHFGEGRYDEQDAVVAQLLSER